MRRILDYAGMFPPAKLSFKEAVRCFEIFQGHQHADFLNCLVLPLDHAARMEGRSIPLSLLVPEKELWQAQFAPTVASIEIAWSGDESVLTHLNREVVPNIRVFLELDWRKPVAPLMEKIAAGGGRCAVKLRTGGVTAESIPPAGAIADFLLGAARYQLPVKATAGLHSPVPNYDPSVGSRTHGFLNFFCAGFLAFTGRADRDLLVSVIETFGYADFEFTEQSLRCGTTSFPSKRWTACAASASRASDRAAFSNQSNSSAGTACYERE
jgi:hypothetical protein